MRGFGRMEMKNGFRFGKREAETGVKAEDHGIRCGKPCLGRARAFRNQLVKRTHEKRWTKDAGILIRIDRC